MPKSCQRNPENLENLDKNEHWILDISKARISEAHYPNGDAPGFELPGSCKKQDSSEDLRTIERARYLMELAKNNQLRYHYLGLRKNTLNCWGFSGVEK